MSPALDGFNKFSFPSAISIYPLRPTYSGGISRFLPLYGSLDHLGTEWGSLGVPGLI